MAHKPDKSCHDAGLSPSQRRALEALLESVTIQAAARRSGVSERQIYRYLTEEPFQRAYLARRQQQVALALHLLQHQAVNAAAALVQALTTGEHPAKAAVHVRAAVHVLELSMRGLEMEAIAERVAVLEARLASLEQGPRA